ncbi:MAG: hypothetical protein A2X64_04330 [Ignavibacteria bacterium GWF2_33_9]|nr:MAG: hypothetical protein A2X64_04330 [Ignavibacteria bacterium GWF2_33_9]
MKKSFLIVLFLFCLPQFLFADENYTNHIQIGPGIGWSFMGINTKAAPDGFENWPKFTNSYNASLTLIFPISNSKKINIIPSFGKIVFPYEIRDAISSDGYDEVSYFANYLTYGLALTYDNFYFGVDYAYRNGIKMSSTNYGNYSIDKDSVQNNIILSLGGLVEFWKSKYGSVYCNAGFYYCLNDVYKENPMLGDESFNTKPISFNVMFSYLFNVYKIY